MNETEKYEFDRLGYLVIPNMLTAAEVKSLANAVDTLEQHALENAAKPPYKTIAGPSLYSGNWHQDPEYGYFTPGPDVKYPNLATHHTLWIEEFWNASPAFDVLLDHKKTMGYIRSIVQENPMINNSQIFIRYPGSKTTAHLGGPSSKLVRYGFLDGKIDCTMVRMIYFIHDVGPENGPFSVVPGTHKSNYNSPYDTMEPEEEPGMIPLTVKAGDAILFTENLRHGGFTNRSNQTRKTVHVGYGPYWMMSMNAVTAFEAPYILPQTRERLSKEQNDLFWPAWDMVQSLSFQKKSQN